MPEEEFKPIKRSRARRGLNPRVNPRVTAEQAQPPLPQSSQRRLGINTRADTFPTPSSEPFSATAAPGGYVQRTIREDELYSPVNGDVSFFAGTGYSEEHQTAPPPERSPVAIQRSRSSSRGHALPEEPDIVVLEAQRYRREQRRREIEHGPLRRSSSHSRVDPARYIPNQGDAVMPDDLNMAAESEGIEERLRPRGSVRTLPGYEETTPIGHRSLWASNRRLSRSHSPPPPQELTRQQRRELRRREIEHQLQPFQGGGHR